MSNCGCVIGAQFFGCIMHADDLVLLSPSVCDLQNMIDICVYEASCLSLKSNVNKSCVLRFGTRYLQQCKQVTLDGKVIEYVSTARYFGVLLPAGRSFGVDLHYIKLHFYFSFNSIFHRSKKFMTNLLYCIWFQPTANFTCYMLLTVLVCLLRNYVTLNIRGNVQFHIYFILLVLMFNMYVTLHLKCLLILSYRIDRSSFWLVYVMLMTLF